jgi:hypothetical protein
MSWLEKIKTDLIIKTGDGRPFKPLWINAQKSKEYNIAEFEFPNVSGTLVKRSKPKGRRYPIEIYFQGENHLDQSEAFETSADDPRPWIITHPFYGSITVQPIGLAFDNSEYNTTKITGTIVETITDENPRPVTSAVDKITEDFENTNSELSASYANSVIPDTTDKQNLTANNLLLYEMGKKSISDSIASEEYFNLFNTANTAITNATTEPLAAINAAQAVITAPSLFSQSVQSRLSLLSDQFEKLNESVSTITERSLKLLFENQAGSIISAMALSASTPLNDSDYGNRQNVIDVIEILIDNYDSYLVGLDALQTANGGSPTSYIPSATALNNLSNLINFTISNLFNIALNSKQERKIYLEADSNPILLTHRFYGLDNEDVNLEKLISDNSLSLEEILQIKKGRPISYYV